MDAKQLTISLCGKWYHSYGAAPCPVCQSKGDKRQNALTLADGRNGLLLNCKKSGCAFRDILVAAGIESGGYTPPNPHAMAPREAERQKEAAKRTMQARWLWEEAQPIGGSLAEAYLRARGITCSLPETLRYAPSCWHASATRIPAMLAMVEGCDTFAAHRTYLRADGTGKADLEPAKAMLGAVQGGAVRLSGEPGPLVVCEGLETGLSLASGLLSAQRRYGQRFRPPAFAGCTFPSNRGG